MSKAIFCILCSVFCVLLLIGCQQLPMTIKGDLYIVPAGVEVPTIEGETVTIIITKEKMLLMSESFFKYYWDREWSE